MEIGKLRNMSENKIVDLPTFQDLINLSSEDLRRYELGQLDLDKREQVLVMDTVQMLRES